MRIIGLFNNRDEFKAQQDELSGASVGKRIASFLSDAFTGLTAHETRAAKKEKSGLSRSFLSMLDDGSDIKLKLLIKHIAEAREEAQKLIMQANLAIQGYSLKIRYMQSTGATVLPQNLQALQTVETPLSTQEIDELCAVSESFSDASNPALKDLKDQIISSCSTRDSAEELLQAIEDKSRALDEIDPATNPKAVKQLLTEVKDLRAQLRDIENPDAVTNRFTASADPAEELEIIPLTPTEETLEQTRQ